MPSASKMKKTFPKQQQQQQQPQQHQPQQQQQLITPQKTKPPGISSKVSKVAYLCVKPTTADDLNSREEFVLALQHAGYNPTKSTAFKYWKDNERTRMSFEEFQDVVASEPTPSLNHLIDSFKKLDIEGSGYIGHDDFLLAMTTRGDKLPSELIYSVLTDPAFNASPGKFDYKKYCEAVVKTSSDLIRIAGEKIENEGKNLTVNSRTYKVKKKTATSATIPSPDDEIITPSNHWKRISSKGCFFFEGETIISHQYVLEISSRTKIEIAIQPLILGAKGRQDSVDCQIFIFSIQSEKSHEGKYKLIARTPLANTPQDFISWRGHLDVGSYLLLPATTGCKLKRRKCQPHSDIHLTRRVNGTVQLSEEFRDVLTNIYDQVDLDCNGTLSRQEFNLFNWRTSGEEVQDEEWKVVEENFTSDSGELTLSGFLQLHQLEAEDNGGDSAELWVTLNAMGYNHGLVQDEAALYQVTVRAEKDAINLRVSGLKSGGSTLDKAMNRCIMEGSRSPKPVPKAPEVLIFREDFGSNTSFVIQNKSPKSVTLSLDFSGSQNVLINHPHFAFSTSLTGKSTLFVAHLLPKDPTHESKVILKENFIR